MAAAKKTTSPKKSAGAASSASGSSAAEKTAAKKTPAKKPASRKAPAEKNATKKAPAKKAPAKKTAAKTTTTKKAPATKAPAEKTATKKSAAKKSGTATSTAKKAPAKKTATKKAPAKKAPAKKTAAKKTATKKATNSSLLGTPSILSNDRPDRLEIPKPRGKSKDGVSYTKDFDVKFLKAQRDELLSRRAGELARATRLEDEATSLIEDGEMGDVQFDDEGGEGDTMVVQRDLDRVLSSQARQTIGDIDAALARIEAGTYGYSEVSGRPIPRERLEAIPETTVLAAEKVSGIGGR
jgi:RNA polymerase-binding transcription factor DksA